MKQFTLLAMPALLLCLSVVGCASGPELLDEGVRVDIPAEGPEPGPLEAQALMYLEQLTDIVSNPNLEARDVVAGVQEFLQTNEEAIRENARQIAERMEGFDEGELAYYEEHFSAYFAEARLNWNTSLRAFRSEHPRAGGRVVGLMRHFD